MSDPWLSHHLHTLGFHHFRLHMYTKLAPLHAHSGGGVIKNTVHDLARFVRTSAASTPTVQKHIAPPPAPLGRRHLRTWLYMCVANMFLSNAHHQLDHLSNDILRLYFRSHDVKSPLTAPSSVRQRVLRETRRCYAAAPIDRRLLYGSPLQRCIRLADPALSIALPPLPRISSKLLLARALLHKELYRALVASPNPLHRRLRRLGLASDYPSVSAIVRNDLLLLDGLGDLFLATEASAFLYAFKSSVPYSEDPTFGKKTYTLLQTILATNSLLLRIALAYNLPFAFNDSPVQSLLCNLYIPISTGSSAADHDIRFEEEFLADYFEQYVAALYLELPQLATTWIRSLFELICFLIADSYKIASRRKRVCHYDYRAWSVDVIGRSIC